MAIRELLEIREGTPKGLRLLRQALRLSGGAVRGAARALGCTDTSLYQAARGNTESLALFNLLRNKGQGARPKAKALR